MIDAQYKAKIKTTDELVAAIGPRPRKNKVIMCHGTFDLVHPGHIRHLLYAKSKADILVASLTADAHINKANYRPFVPQDLRAINLAALEMVDYVIIDRNPTPLDNIALIQPDYFAKGYEYATPACIRDAGRDRRPRQPTAAKSCSRPATSSTPRPADRDRAAEHGARKAVCADGGGRAQLRRAARRAGQL